ncbi:MAG: fasciclin domain-containing protein [Bacteroidota bacterium]
MITTPLRSRWVLALTLLLFVGFTVGCDSSDDEPTQNIVELAADTPSLSTLVAAVNAAGLGNALSAEDPITVFAPIDAAFAEIDGTVDALLEADNSALLTKVLQYHVVAGRFEAADLEGRTTLTTLAGQTLRINTEGGVTINNATVQTANIEASNGIVHLIDGVLLESLDVVERAIVTPDLSTLVTAVTAGQLVGTLQDADNITLFAPTNDAFGRVDPATLTSLLEPANRGQLQNILSFHVAPQLLFAADLMPGAQVGTLLANNPLTVTLNDNGAFVNDIRIIATDIEVSNGVVHLIENVLLPPS